MAATAATPESLLDELGAPLDPDRYDWGRAGSEPLTDEERFQLSYAAQVEWGTEDTFVRVDSSRDPVVREFLRVWLDQEVAHARLLTRVVEAHGGAVPPLHQARRVQWSAARAHWTNRALRRVMGDDFSAVHMAWGAVNELTTVRFYGIVRSTTRNGLLRDLLRDVMAQEALHYSFYRAVAIRHLERDPARQQRVRWVLGRVWSPVGVGLHSRADADRVMRTLFANRDDEVDRIDASISRIPGLDGLDLIRRTVGARGTA